MPVLTAKRLVFIGLLSCSQRDLPLTVESANTRHCAFAISDDHQGRGDE